MGVLGRGGTLYKTEYALFYLFVNVHCTAAYLIKYCLKEIHSSPMEKEAKGLDKVQQTLRKSQSKGSSHHTARPAGPGDVSRRSELRDKVIQHLPKAALPT